ncbi:hypothetical protein OB920_17675 [Halobacteria archaeon HArc-gm2]|nr:hypothetical protein [Halobacteria archaeon HArc-gm2]
MPLHPPKSNAPDDAIWWRFKNQSRVTHLLVALGGFAVWFGVYAYWLDGVAGDLHFAAAESPAAIVARQEAIRVASVACWVWFSLAFMVGKGGPFLNTIIYPVLALVFGPLVTSLAVSGSVPDTLYSSTKSAIHPIFVVDAISLLVLGMFVCLVLVGGFLVVIHFVTGTGEAWAEKHMPEAYHEIELENPEKWED